VPDDDTGIPGEDSAESSDDGDAETDEE